MAGVDGTPPRNWTTGLRTRIARTVPPGEWLPDRQPAYVRSWIYVFGAATLAAFLVALATGLVLTIGGVAWWHTSAVGHFVNSTHLWSVELFFACMVIHLWGAFFMAAWRGRRVLPFIPGLRALPKHLGVHRLIWRHQA
jgi:ubiquinol-cytochrome c reductase cytochrome b subunit